MNMVHSTREPDVGIILGSFVCAAKRPIMARNPRLGLALALALALPEANAAALRLVT